MLPALRFVTCTYKSKKENNLRDQLHSINSSSPVLPLFNTILHGVENIFALSRIFSNKSFHQKVLFQVKLFIANNSWKFEVPKRMESVPILRFREVTFRNLSILWPNLTKMML